MYGYHFMVSMIMGAMVSTGIAMLSFMIKNEPNYVSHTPTWRERPIEK